MRSASSYYIIPAQIARSQISFSNYFMNLWLRRTSILDFSFLSPPDKSTMLLSLTVLSLPRSCSLLSSPVLVLVYWTWVVPLDLRYMVFTLSTICIHFGCFLSKYVFKMIFKRQYSCWLTDSILHCYFPRDSSSLIQLICLGCPRDSHSRLHSARLVTLSSNILIYISDPKRIEVLDFSFLSKSLMHLKSSHFYLW